MRRSSPLVVAALAACAALLTAMPASAHPTRAVDPTLPTDVTYAATDNVTYHGRFPEHFGTAGGIVAPGGEVFFVTDPRGVYAYDITTPEAPTRLGSLSLFQSGTGVALAQEDPDTNGEILLVDGSPTPSASAQLRVVDVSDPAQMAIVASVNVTDHTWSCITGIDDTGAENSCAYAYGRTGHIIDLTDPAAPVKLQQTWRNAVGYNGYTHDMTEVRPGLVLASGATVVLMDTTDPAAPVQLTRITQVGRFDNLGYHSVEWARGGADRWLIAGTEIAPDNGLAGSDCEGENSVIETWDASSVIAALEAYEAGAPVDQAFADAAFTKVDAFDAGGRGIFLQGGAPSHLLYCAHWMEQHPDFADGGRLAVSYYDRGTRFVDVAADGTMSEVGWIVGADSYSGSVQWISDEVAYVMDYRRGMEVVSISDAAATGVRTNAPDVIALSSDARPHAEWPADAVGYGALVVFALLLVGPGRLRRRA